MLNLEQTSIFTISVGKLEKSEKWYKTVLGFTTDRKLDEPRWCEMSAAGGAVRIGLAEVQKVELGHAALTLVTKNIEQAAETLKAAKVDCSAISDIEGLTRLITFEDPDGNRLMLRQDVFD